MSQSWELHISLFHLVGVAIREGREKILKKVTVQADWAWESSGWETKHVSPWPGKFWIQTNLGWIRVLQPQVSVASQVRWLLMRPPGLRLNSCPTEDFRVHFSDIQGVAPVAFYIISSSELQLNSAVPFSLNWKEGCTSGSGDSFTQALPPGF